MFLHRFTLRLDRLWNGPVGEGRDLELLLAGYAHAPPLRALERATRWALHVPGAKAPPGALAGPAALAGAPDVTDDALVALDWYTQAGLLDVRAVDWPNGARLVTVAGRVAHVDHLRQVQPALHAALGPLFQAWLPTAIRHGKAPARARGVHLGVVLPAGRWDPAPRWQTA